MASEKKSKESEERPGGEVTMDAVRHVGKTLESEGIFVPTGDLPENRIEREGLVDAADAATGDEWDREADAMGAERLKTRLPGDTSSEPHTDTVADNATTMDSERPRKPGRAA